MMDWHEVAALTVVSLCEDVPAPPERREALRHLSVLKAAILRTVSGEELCMVRNISAGGLMAHVYSSLQVSTPVTVEFLSGNITRGQVVWRKEDLIGIKFADLADVAALLEMTNHDGVSVPVQRAPRVGVHVMGRLRSGSHSQPVLLGNISQRGVRVHLTTSHHLGDEVVLTADGLPTLAGSVRWQQGRQAGIAFNELISFDYVARWVAGSRASG